MHQWFQCDRFQTAINSPWIHNYAEHNDYWASGNYDGVRRFASEWLAAKLLNRNRTDVGAEVRKCGQQSHRIASQSFDNHYLTFDKFDYHLRYRQPHSAITIAFDVTQKCRPIDPTDTCCVRAHSNANAGEIGWLSTFGHQEKRSQFIEPLQAWTSQKGWSDH